MSLEVDTMIDILDRSLEDIRSNLLIAQLSNEQLLFYYKSIERMTFNVSFSTDAQAGRLESLRRQYLTLFSLYI